MASGAVIAIAMTLNELCTNTTKFGALSVPAGRVDIVWTVDPATQRLCLKWTENNGLAVSYSTHSSTRARMSSGKDSPSLPSAERLTLNVNLVAPATGSSAGFAPWRIFSTYLAAS